MSAPREACNIQLVKIQPEESPASTSELNFTPDRVICHREANGKGYRATTQVKGLSSEIYHRVGGRYCSSRRRQNSYNHYRQGYKNPTESKTVALYQKDTTGTWENQYIPNVVRNIIDDSLLSEVLANGGVTSGVCQRLCTYAVQAERLSSQC